MKRQSRDPSKGTAAGTGQCPGAPGRYPKVNSGNSLGVAEAVRSGVVEKVTLVGYRDNYLLRTPSFARRFALMAFTD
jgi:hypothetical protein